MTKRLQLATTNRKTTCMRSLKTNDSRRKFSICSTGQDAEICILESHFLSQETIYICLLTLNICETVPKQNNHNVDVKVQVAAYYMKAYNL